MMLNIALIGGPRTGKTSLLRRLTHQKFQSTYHPTLQQFHRVTLCYAEMIVNVIDVDGCFVGKKDDDRISSDSRRHDFEHTNQFKKANFEDCQKSNIYKELCQCNAVMLVIDAADPESFQYIDCWLDFLDLIPLKQTRYLVVNKCDQQPWAVSAANIALFCSNTGVEDWAFTVSHPALGDVCYSRGSIEKQIPPEQLLRQIVYQAIATRTSFDELTGSYRVPKYPLFAYQATCDELNVLKYLSWTTEAIERTDEEERLSIPPI